MFTCETVGAQLNPCPPRENRVIRFFLEKAADAKRWPFRLCKHYATQQSVRFSYNHVLLCCGPSSIFFARHKGAYNPSHPSLSRAYEQAFNSRQTSLCFPPSHELVRHDYLGVSVLFSSYSYQLAFHSIQTPVFSPLFAWNELALTVHTPKMPTTPFYFNLLSCCFNTALNVPRPFIDRDMTGPLRPLLQG